MKTFLIATFFILALLTGCRKENQRSLGSQYIKISYDGLMHSKVQALYPGAKPLMNDFQSSEFLNTAPGKIDSFSIIHSKKSTFRDSMGSGEQLSLTGIYKGQGQEIEKHLVCKLYTNFPTMIFTRVEYINKGPQALFIKSWVNQHYTVSATQDSVPFWSFQSGSYEERPDWVLPLKKGFFRKNYMGMNATDYGGGTPISDIWRRDAGMAVGHVSGTPKLVSLPVAFDSTARGADLWIEQDVNKKLDTGDTLHTLNTFVSVHQKDYFNTLKNFSRFMQEKGLHFNPFPKTSYEPVWCAWGYERNFTVQQVLNTLPKVKKLGFKWVVLDDGWQTAEGDWFLNPKKFPRGDTDMRAFTDKIHSYGLKAKLWLAPLAADPGTQLLKNHPDMLLLNKDGSKQLISWWDSYYLCPAYPPVKTYFRKLITRILVDWNFDGLKLDGQHQNAVPPCYNPAHQHTSPTESVEQLPSFFKMIYRTALSLKPQAVVEICPCGDACTFYNMPYMNQPVASDPTSSWQIRLKGKTYKALMGPNVPYYGDHVELSDGKDDFASTIGIGGVPGSKFIWPPGVHQNTESGDVSLIPGKEKEWAGWLRIYRSKMLPLGRYLGNLYDIGFDRPEAHVILKGDTLYYAFYAKQWQGKVELRGLSGKTYKIIDYVNNVDLGTVSGPDALLDTKFSKYLLIEAIPQK